MCFKEFLIYLLGVMEFISFLYWTNLCIWVSTDDGYMILFRMLERQTLHLQKQEEERISKGYHGIG